MKLPRTELDIPLIWNLYIFVIHHFHIDLMVWLLETETTWWYLGGASIRLKCTDYIWWSVSVTFCSAEISSEILTEMLPGCFLCLVHLFFLLLVLNFSNCLMMDVLTIHHVHTGDCASTYHEQCTSVVMFRFVLGPRHMLQKPSPDAWFRRVFRADARFLTSLAVFGWR